MNKQTKWSFPRLHVVIGSFKSFIKQRLNENCASKKSGIDAAGFLNTTYHSGAAAVQVTHGLCLIMLVKTHEIITSSRAPCSDLLSRNTVVAFYYGCFVEYTKTARKNERGCLGEGNVNM